MNHIEVIAMFDEVGEYILHEDEGLGWLPWPVVNVLNDDPSVYLWVESRWDISPQILYIGRTIQSLRKRHFQHWQQFDKRQRKQADHLLDCLWKGSRISIMAMWPRKVGPTDHCGPVNENVALWLINSVSPKPILLSSRN